MKNTVGFFGGTFDPVHFGHINLAIQMLEAHKLDRVVFCPARYSPLKESQLPSASEEHRLNMVKLAISPIPQFILIDWEVQKEGPSYTIDVIRFLKKTTQDTEFRLILGEDSLVDLPRWKDVEALLSLAPPLVGSRHLYIENNLSLLPASMREWIKKGMTQIPIMDVSSTGLRERLFQGLYCGHLIPAKVLDYIQENQLY